MRQPRPFPVLIAATALVCAVVAGLAALFAAMPGISAARLWSGLDGIAGAIDRALPRHPGPTVTAFLGGMAVGWIGALLWTGVRRRRESLLLLDPRGPDMAFTDGVSHVTRYAATSPAGEWSPGNQAGNEDRATALILGAARDGRLSLWRRTAANTMLRIPRARLGARRLASGTSLRESRGDLTGHDLLLRRAEVVSIWPVHATIDVGATRVDGPAC